MIVKIKDSTIVHAAQDTPRRTLWSSSLDLRANDIHTPSIYFYMANGSSNMFDARVLKEALSKALVPFYPIAGRLKRDQNGRMEIDCNDKGVLFVEAETNCVFEDLGDFAPTSEFLSLIPTVDRSVGISMYPLLVLQVTYFKCGGVSLGVGFHHFLADGLSALHFISTWSKMARGLSLDIPPIIDRTILRGRDPPQPLFEHNETPPTSSTHIKNCQSFPTIVSIFKISKAQLNTLKTKSEENGNKVNYSSFQMLAAHLWRCACKARELQDNEITTLRIGVDGRARLRPEIPREYFGNVIFYAIPRALVRDLQVNPLCYAANRIHDTFARMDDNYLRSSIDYTELHTPNKLNFDSAKSIFSRQNFWLITWDRLPIFDADFGWGRPIFMGPGPPTVAGQMYILPSPTEDGSLSLIVSLETNHMKVFEKVLYEI